MQIGGVYNMETEVKVKNITEEIITQSGVNPPKKGVKRKIVYSQIVKIILSVLAPFVLLGAWQIGSKAGVINPSILPAPSSLVETFKSLVSDGKLQSHLIVSLARVFKGFAIGAVSGIAVGSIMGLSKTLNRVLGSLVGLLRPIPMIAWIPLLILWMGIDESSKVTVIVIGSFWPILINTIHGIQTVDTKLLEVATILEKSKCQVITKVVFPSALPSIFTGVRLGMGSAWTCVVAAEMIAASKGIGYMITYARELSQPDVMLVGVFSIGIIGLLIDTVIIRGQNFVLRWSLDTK
jgi:sulfonate transport system permease protein